MYISFTHILVISFFTDLVLFLSCISILSLSLKHFKATAVCMCTVTVVTGFHTHLSQSQQKGFCCLFITDSHLIHTVSMSVCSAVIQQTDSQTHRSLAVVHSHLGITAATCAFLCRPV